MIQKKLKRFQLSVLGKRGKVKEFSSPLTFVLSVYYLLFGCQRLSWVMAKAVTKVPAAIALTEATILK